MNSFVVLGAVPQQVNTTQVQTLANIPFTGVSGNLSYVKVSSSQAVYTIEYQLDSKVSAVGQVTETYTVTPQQVTIDFVISNYQKSVTNLVVRVPAFLFDGQRNTTVTKDPSANKIQVSLPGDAVSGLGTTCATFAVSTSSRVTWSTEATPYYSRNGFMNAINAQLTSGGSSTAVSLTITPQC